MRRYNKRNNQVSISLSVKQELQTGVETFTGMQGMRQKGKYLEIGNQNEVYYLQPESVLYVEADGNYCDIHLTDGDVFETVSFQRAEIARIIEEQLPYDKARMFSLIGRTYLININYVMHINSSRQQLTFSINTPGTCRKKSIKVSAAAIRNLRIALDGGEEVSVPRQAKVMSKHKNGGFASHLQTQMKQTEHSYDIGDDEVMILGRL